MTFSERMLTEKQLLKAVVPKHFLKAAMKYRDCKQHLKKVTNNKAIYTGGREQ